jgi:hypothetical protein
MAYGKLSAVLLSAILVSAGAALAAGNGGPKRSIAPNTAKANHGHFLCTAAINDNGTIATNGPATSYINAAKTFQIGTGIYQVAFISPCNNVQLVNGWFRVVQPDTLTTGTLATGSTCHVADRAGEPSAIWVQCGVGTTLTDMSFTLSVSR